jgi:hypothetical protein
MSIPDADANAHSLFPSYAQIDLQKFVLAFRCVEDPVE